MDEYISRNELLKDVQSNVAEAHNERCAQLLEAILNAPTADVVPKSEVEKLVQVGTRLGQENETLKDNNEHLAVILEETKIELKAMRGAANSLKMHYEKAMEVQKEVHRLASEIKAELPLAYAEVAKNVASEIFAEIEKLHLHITNDFDLRRYAELEKKYTEGEDKPASEEKYFSPEDVRKMTNQEVREKYTAIRRSMERW